MTKVYIIKPLYVSIDLIPILIPLYCSFVLIRLSKTCQNQMKEIEFRVIFNRKKQLNRKGQGLVQIEAYQAGLRKYFGTGVKTTPEKWKPKPDKDIWVADKHQNTLIINAKDALRKYRDTFVAVHGKMSLQDFDNFFESKSKKEKSIVTDFLVFYEQQLEKEKKGRDGVKIEYSTWQQLKTNLDCLKQCFPNGLSFDELTYATIDKYNYFLLCRKGIDGNGMKLNSIDKRHRQTRKYINLAVKYGYLSRDKSPYLNFERKTEKVKKVWLTRTEWERVENLNFGPEQKLIEITRDMFLFSTYTGLRYSDVHKLTSNDFVQTEKGLQLTFTAKKTAKTLSLPLYSLWDGKPQEIANKYLNNGYNRLFYGITNPKANKLIKEVAKLAKIEKHITFHDSRDTFGSHAIRKLTVKVVQNILQHADLKTTQGYLHLDDEERDDLLEKTNWN